jgi:tetratricopeptide (TPR) repeat protein
LDDWVQLNIDDPVERRRRADLRMMAGDRKGALRDYMGVLRRSGRDLSLVVPIVDGASQAGQLASTLLEAELLCVDHPQSSAAWMVVGLISQLVGDAEAAVQAIERAQGLGVVLSEGSKAALEKAKTQLEQTDLPSSGKAPFLDDPVSRIIRLVQQKRWDDGESSIERELLRTPEDPRLHYILGELRLKRDGPAAAQGPIEKVLSIQPSYGPALNMWAWIQAEQGIELDEAQIRVTQALNRQPAMASYWDTLGWILHLRGQHRKARIVLSRALRMSPKDDTVRKHFETCLSHEAEKAQ